MRSGDAHASPGGAPPAGSRGRLAHANRAMTLVLLALMPKCPMCVVAYAGFFAAIGISVGLVLRWMTAALVCAACVILARWLTVWLLSGCWVPFAVGAAGVCLSLAGRFTPAPPSVGWAGAALFVAGACAEFQLGRRRPHAAQGPVPP